MFKRLLRKSQSYRVLLDRPVRWRFAPFVVPVIAGSTMVTAFAYYKERHVLASMLTEDDEERHQVYTDHKLTKREVRFLEFASIEYEDVIYMSPMDFIDSLTLDKPRERVYRRVIQKEDVTRMLNKTPPLRKGGKDLFRILDQNGLISYADYIFLVTLLTKSQSAFRVAFQMFDDDENGRVDKEEFLLIRNLISSLRSTRNLSKEKDGCQLDTNEFRFVIKRLQDRLFAGSDSYSILFSKSEEEVKRTDTTLLLHLFGLRGSYTLSLDEFRIFYHNLQSELMEIEFTEFARGKPKISPLDFTWLVLRYTVLDRESYKEYVQRVASRGSDEDEGVTLAQWAAFSLFLNNLEQFVTATRLYTNADIPVSREEFARAVHCTTGQKLDDNVVNLIFRIFDKNGDGKLSYREFLAVMNDRMHRGLKGKSDKLNLKAFRSCVVNEMSRM